MGKNIESELFKALVLTKLIKCREESNYHRCGRTDKGVSAYQQVITIDLRSNLKQGWCTHSWNTREVDYLFKEQKYMNTNPY